MRTHPTLYKRTSTGAVQTWWIEQEGERYRVATGQDGGAITRSGWTVCEGKNLGRKNATTPETQADSEVASAYKIKLNQGRYWERIEDIDKSEYFAPMLAHPVEKYPPKADDFEMQRIFAQPKLDGVRCIATKTGLWTRKGKPITAAPHVFESLTPIFAEIPDLVLDGELYNHEYKAWLNRISGLVRRTKLSPEELEETTRVLQYHIYDCLGPDETASLLHVQDGLHPESSYRLRQDWMRNASPFQWNDDDSGNLTVDNRLFLVQTHLIGSQTELDELNNRWIEEGYEGQIIRVDGFPYENKRSKYLLKRKEFDEREFTITGIEEGTGNRSGMAGYICYLTDEDKPFKTGIAGGEDFYRYLLENASRYIGGEGTVRFKGYTEYGIPYIPVTHAVFEGKRNV